MKYKIINHEDLSETVELIANHILEDAGYESISLICAWYPELDLIYRSLFNLNVKISKSVKNNISRKLRNRIKKLYSKINIVNMYDFILSDNVNESNISTFDKFQSVLDPAINFCSFRLKDQLIINKELLINPSNFDRTIKLCTNGEIDFSIVYVNAKGDIPFIENSIENIGTNLTTIDDDEIDDLKFKLNIKQKIEQTINCGNRCLTKSHKIIAIIEEEAIKFLTNDNLEKDSSSSIKTLISHDDVIYIVKSWKNEPI